MLLPCAQDNNDKRKNLINIVLLFLDESMIGCCPNTMKLSGLPNCALEPKNLVLLGAIFNNSVDWKSGLIAHIDAKQNPAQEVSKIHNSIK